jgi:hypothetical protein
MKIVLRKYARGRIMVSDNYWSQVITTPGVASQSGLRRFFHDMRAYRQPGHPAAGSVAPDAVPSGGLPTAGSSAQCFNYRPVKGFWMRLTFLTQSGSERGCPSRKLLADSMLRCLLTRQTRRKKTQPPESVIALGSGMPLHPQTSLGRNGV